MYDDYITRFRRKVTVENDTSAKVSDFIAQSLSRMEVILERLQKAIPVIFINSDKEGGDESIMYSYTADAIQIGDYVTAFGKSHLVYKEITNLKREDYIDCWKTVMCNINFIFNGNTIKAYFKGTVRTVQSEEQNLSQHLGVDSKAEVFIIVPDSILLKATDTITIKDKGWKVTNRDDITNPGIAYISLEEYNIPDTTKTSVVDEPDYNPVITNLVPGLIYIFETEDGYFISNASVKIVEKTGTSIKIQIPFGISSLELKTKKDGIVVTTNYTVGE